MTAPLEILLDKNMFMVCIYLQMKKTIQYTPQRKKCLYEVIVSRDKRFTNIAIYTISVQWMDDKVLAGVTERARYMVRAISSPEHETSKCVSCKLPGPESPYIVARTVCLYCNTSSVIRT